MEQVADVNLGTAFGPLSDPRDDIFCQMGQRAHSFCGTTPRPRALYERYIEGELHFHIALKAIGAQDREFVLFAIPRVGKCDAGSEEVPFFDSKFVNLNANGRQQPMYLPVPELVQTPEGFVPSALMCPEAHAQVCKTLETGGRAIPEKILPNIFGVVAEGEFGALWLRQFGDPYRRRINSMIKGSPKVVNNIKDGGAEGEWDVSIQPNDVADIDAWTLVVGEWSASVFPKERTDVCLHILYVAARSR